MEEHISSVEHQIKSQNAKFVSLISKIEESTKAVLELGRAMNLLFIFAVKSQSVDFAIIDSISGNSDSFDLQAVSIFSIMSLT